MKKIISERTDRINRIFPSLLKRKDLYGEIAAPKSLLYNLQSSCKIVLYDCLSTIHKDKVFNLDLPIEKFFKTYKSDIIKLPNITPNGLVLPKLEILNSVNLLNKNIFRLIEFLNLKAHGEVACPVNLRLNFGVNKNKEFNERPKSSTHWHTDIWAGQNANELMIHVPIFGDFRENGIVMSKPTKTFYPDYVKTLNSFKDGSDVTKDMDKDTYKTRLKIGHIYIFDSFLFHKTIARGSEIRGIISFPVKLKEKVPSDIYHNELRSGEYQSYEKWEKMGKETLLVSSKRLEDYQGQDDNRNTYADKFESVSIA